MLELNYNFSKAQIRGLNSVLNRLLLSFEVDILNAENQLPEMVLLEFYKENLSSFMFPRESEDIHFNTPVCMAFLKVFRVFNDDTFESLLIQQIVQDVMTIFTDGKPFSQGEQKIKKYPLLAE